MQPARLAIRLLGVPSIQFDGGLWKFAAPPRCMVLLALLALSGGAGRARTSLIADLWPDELETEARTNLRRHLHRLLRGLPKIEGVDWLVAGGDSVALNPGAPLWVDVPEFDRAIDDPARRDVALELYRGDLLEGSYDEAILAERERLRVRFLDACAHASMDARRRMEYNEAARLSDRMLALDEWREDALRLGMTVRYESGDRSSALAQFERFASRLFSEMGVRPTPETLALRDAILTNAPIPGAGAATRGTDEELAVVPAGTPFVGRAAERAALESAWHRAAGGRGLALFLEGEAGIGKSRLISEFASSVASQGGRVLIGETSNPQAYPYEPLVDALRRGLAYVIESPVGSPWLGALAEVMPELAAAFPEGSTSEPLADVEKARARLFEAMARAIERLARTRPLLLILEDVHWAQPATFEAIDAMARRIRSVPALVVVTYRGGEIVAAQPARAVRERLVAERYATTLELGALGDADVRDLVGAAIDARDDASELARIVSARSGGNPLFAGQLVRRYAETGELPVETGGEQSLAQTILARAHSLDVATQTLAQTAAVVGRSFTIDVLADALGWSEGEVFDGLGALVERGLARPSGSSAFSYAFAHALIETAIYDAIPAAERSMRHRRVAAVMRQMDATGSRDALAAIARHWSLGGEPQRAAHAYAAAAHAALAMYARDEAIGYARFALQVEPAPAGRYDMLALLATAQRGYGDPQRWKSDLDELERAAASLGPEQRFRTFEELERYYRQTQDVERQREAIVGMLRLVEAELPEKRATALYTDASLAMYEGRFADALVSLEHALDVALADGDASNAAMAREGLAQTYIRLGRGDDARATIAAMRADPDVAASAALRRRLLNAELYVAHGTEDIDAQLRAGAELLEVAGDIGDLYAQALAHGYLLLGGRYRFAVRVTREHARRSAEIFGRIGAHASRASTLSNAATFERYLGRAGAALALVDEAIEQARAMGATHTLGDRLLERSLACAMLGDAKAAFEAAREADGLAQRMGDRRLQPATRMALGAAMLMRGARSRAKALETMGQAVALARDGGSVAALIDHVCTYALALADAGRVSEAISAAGELRELTRAHPAMAWHPSRVHWALARVAQAGGDEPAFKRHVELGKHALHKELARFDDAESAASYEKLPFNRNILDAASGSGRFVDAASLP